MDKGIAEGLELRVPPPVIVALCALSIWGLAPGSMQLSGVSGLLAVLLAVLGGALALASALAFWRAQTTLNPLNPQRSTHLVVGGVYRWTRNPIYLGDLCLLVSWSLILGQAWGWGGLGCLVFVCYIERFQIRPEERALQQLFGHEFEQYCQQVPRWVSWPWRWS